MDIDSNGIIAGIFKTTDPNSDPQEFTGISVSTDTGEIHLAFGISWTLEGMEEKKYETVFAGSIVRLELELDWAVLRDGQCVRVGNNRLVSGFGKVGDAENQQQPPYPNFVVATSN